MGFIGASSCVYMTYFSHTYPIAITISHPLSLPLFLILTSLSSFVSLVLDDEPVIFTSITSRDKCES